MGRSGVSGVRFQALLSSVSDLFLCIGLFCYFPCHYIIKSDLISGNVSEIWNTSCPIYLEGSHPKIPSDLCHVTGIIAAICFRMLSFGSTEGDENGVLQG